jgi:hypothetical protein
MSKAKVIDNKQAAEQEAVKMVRNIAEMRDKALELSAKLESGKIGVRQANAHATLLRTAAICEKLRFDYVIRQDSLPVLGFLNAKDADYVSAEVI